MSSSRTAFLTSLFYLAACGGKRGDAGDILPAGTSGSSGTGGTQTTTGIDKPTDPGDASGTGGMSSAASGGSAGTMPAAPIDASAEHIDEPVFPDSFFQASNYGFYLNDSWFISSCLTKTGYTCTTYYGDPNQAAPDFEDRGTIYTETFPLGGTTGTIYLMSFKFNGVAEGKYYQGGSWAQASTDLATPGGATPSVDDNAIANDIFYIGGTAVPSNYKVMRIRVLNQDKREVGRYYLNAFPETSGAESHRTFLVSYTHTIEVVGGGFVEYHNQDPASHSIDNCGPGILTDDQCPAPRNIPNEPTLVLPSVYNTLSWNTQPHIVPLASLNSVNGGQQPWHSQIGHISVTQVVAK